MQFSEFSLHATDLLSSGLRLIEQGHLTSVTLKRSSVEGLGPGSSPHPQIDGQALNEDRQTQETIDAGHV